MKVAVPALSQVHLAKVACRYVRDLQVRPRFVAALPCVDVEPAAIHSLEGVDEAQVARCVDSLWVNALDAAVTQLDKGRCVQSVATRDVVRSAIDFALDDWATFRPWLRGKLHDSDGDFMPWSDEALLDGFRATRDGVDSLPGLT